MLKQKTKILRIATVPVSLKVLTKGQLRFLGQNNYEVYSMSAKGPEIDEVVAQEQVIQHFTIDLTRTISPFRDLKAIFECYRIIKKIKPDIVHTYTPKAGLVGMIAAFLASVPLRLHNVTGLPLMEQTGYKKQILVWVEKLTYLLASQVYVNSVGLMAFIKNNIYDNPKLKILGNGSTNGIDGSFFESNESLIEKSKVTKVELGIKPSDFVWLFIGRIVKDKGINELIEAFLQITTKYPSMKLILVGPYENDLDPILPKTQTEINTNKNIISVGFQNDVRSYLQLADCLVFPSYREGLPNVPMQAACFDLPVIATDINGCNEIIEHEINGLLVRPKDTLALQNAMLRIYTNETLRNNIKAKTRAMILEKYSQAVVWNNLLAEYKHLLENI